MTRAATAERTRDAGRLGWVTARLLSPLRRPTAPPIWAGIAVAAVAIAGETVVVLLLKHLSPGEAFETVYLPGVVVVSAVWGLGLAVATSLASAIALAYTHSWPVVHWAPFDVEGAVILTAFLVVALSTNFVAGLARARAVEADQRRHDAEVAAATLARLNDEQTALRRVATLVAHGRPSDEVFTAVAKEVGLLLGAEITRLVRFEADGTGTVTAAWKRTGDSVPVGGRIPIDGIVATPVLQSGKPARITEQSPPELPAGSYSAVGTPIMVAGTLWGAMTALTPHDRPLPEGTEARMAEFTGLVRTAVANAQARADLLASRARIVAAADDARRRLERDLHDGTQQRLVSLGLKARMAQDLVPAGQDVLKAELSDLASGLADVSQELQEISRGIHPAILARGGLLSAVKTLARRSPVPVTVDVVSDRHLPESAEVAAYYVVAEALTNTAKHAHASEVSVSARADDHNLYLSICDNGIGGADTRRGSGLIGLKDRVEALGGRIQMESPPENGTSLHVTIPIDGS